MCARESINAPESDAVTQLTPIDHQKKAFLGEKNRKKRKGQNEMIIKCVYVGQGKETRRYRIETENGYLIAWFDDLESAAIVLRFLKGAYLNERDYIAAHAAMKAFDKKKDGDDV